MHRFYLLLIVSIFCWHSAAGKSGGALGNITFKNAVVDPDPAPYADFKTLVVPLKRAGNLILIEATVDSLEGNFVLDTGAPCLVLNETYFRDYPKITEKESGGINGESEGSFTTAVHNFHILDLVYSRLTADVTDLSGIENERHVKILGLLGTRLFSKFAITVDLFKNQLYIYKLDSKGNIPADERVFNNDFFVTPFLYVNDVVFIKGSVNSKPLWFAFDSGAESNFLDYDKNKKMIPQMHIIGRMKVTGVGGSQVDVLYAKFDSLVVGNHTFMLNRVLVTNLDKMGKVYGHSVDGILGYDFFIRGIFTINFVKEEFEMYIYTNPQ